MAVRPQAPRKGSVASTVAVLALAVCFAAPVLAASERGVVCDQNREANLDISGQELAATPASHEVQNNASIEPAATTIDSVAADHLLKPRVEATAREVFAESASDSDTEEVLEVESDDDEVEKPRLHRVSENDLVPSRRQMYRKDI